MSMYEQYVVVLSCTILENHDSSILSKLDIQFQTNFRTLPPDRIKEKVPGISLEKIADEDKMQVTPFHLAIIAQQAEVVHVMLESTWKGSKLEVESLTEALAEKSRLAMQPAICNLRSAGNDDDIYV